VNSAPYMAAHTAYWLNSCLSASSEALSGCARNFSLGWSSHKSIILPLYPTIYGNKKVGYCDRRLMACRSQWRLE
jgi:hypothetical protein